VTDETPTPAPRASRARKPAEATKPVESTTPVEPDVPEVVEVPADTAEVNNTEVLAPEPAATVAAPAVQTVYVQAPTPPRKKSNRAVGTIVAVLSAVIFGIAFAIVVAIIGAAETGILSFSFLSAFSFYVPVLFFLVGFVVLVLIVNRANWWVHVFGSIFVALFVYFGTVGALLLFDGVIAHTPSEAGRMFAAALVNPLVVAAALVAREVALWMGFAISARGRRLKARNAEAHTAYQTELAEKRAEYERASAANSSA
jgi:hypothetical protein